MLKLGSFFLVQLYSRKVWPSSALESNIAPGSFLTGKNSAASIDYCELATHVVPTRIKFGAQLVQMYGCSAQVRQVE